MGNRLSGHRVVRGPLLGGLLLMVAPLGAEFALNFTPGNVGGGGGWGGGGGADGWADVECNGSTTGGGGSGWGGTGGGWGSGFRGCGNGYFLQETNSGYYHVIVGDPTTDFALEFYIGGTGNSASGGDFNNWRYPLSSNAGLTGNGSGDATRVHMRQLVKGVGMDQEFLKAQNATKPKITQTINNAGLTAQFSVDMTNSSYATRTTAGVMVNKQTLVVDGLPVGAADFDMGRDSQTSQVTAGQYSRGSGVGASYSYLYGGFNVTAVDWIRYCDPAQNTDHKCDLAGGTSLGSSRGGWGAGGASWGGGTSWGGGGSGGGFGW